MTTRNGARFFSALIASTAIALAIPAAYANGQGTPIEPAPTPAPTTMAPEAPAPMVNEAPPPPNWTGAYVGLDVGYAFQRNNSNRLQFDPTLTGNYVGNIPEANGSPAFTDFESHRRNGIDAGIRAGYDYQFDNFVVGALLEADYNDVKNSETGYTASDYYTLQRKLDFLGAGRLRAGVLVDPNWLIYGTGGVAYGNIKHQFDTSNLDNAFADSGDKGQWGYQVGGGIETKITPDINLGVEYIYTSLKDDDYRVHVAHGTASNLDPFIISNLNGTDIRRDNDRFNVQSVRAVMTYHFNGM